MNVSRIISRIDLLLSKAAPGPPPRPGLEWKEETHRWIRRNNGQQLELPFNQENYSQNKNNQTNDINSTNNIFISAKDDPSLYGKDGKELFSQGIKQSSGAPIRGVVISPDDPIIPDTVYHVTTNLSGVLSSGVLKASGQGGLGGDNKDQIVSMTINKDVADTLKDDLKLSVTVAKLSVNTQRGTEERFKAISKIILLLAEQAKNEGWLYDKVGESGNAIFRFANSVREAVDGDEKTKNWLSGYSGHDMLGQYFNSRQSWTSPKQREEYKLPPLNISYKRNPLIFTDDDVLSHLDENNIDIINIPKSNLKTGAMITNFDVGKNYLDEIRSYGDVPINLQKGMEFIKMNGLYILKKIDMLLEKSAPGPPPRPGLQWKEETSRWIRPQNQQADDAAHNNLRSMHEQNKLRPGDKKFVESALQQYDRNRHLTDRQWEVLHQINARYGGNNSQTNSDQDIDNHREMYARGNDRNVNEDLGIQTQKKFNANVSQMLTKYNGSINLGLEASKRFWASAREAGLSQISEDDDGVKILEARGSFVDQQGNAVGYWSARRWFNGTTRVTGRPMNNDEIAREQTFQAQDYIRRKFDPDTDTIDDFNELSQEIKSLFPQANVNEKLAGIETLIRMNQLLNSVHPGDFDLRGAVNNMRQEVNNKWGVN